MTTPTASSLFVVDSSGWIEYFAAGPNAAAFGQYLADDRLIVPTVILYEVFKKLLRERGKTAADLFLSHALRRTVLPLTEELAMAAAHASLAHNLPMADAMIYASAQSQKAILVTSDEHFRNLPEVIFI